MKESMKGLTEEIKSVTLDEQSLIMYNQELVIIDITISNRSYNQLTLDFKRSSTVLFSLIPKLTIPYK